MDSTGKHRRTATASYRIVLVGCITALVAIATAIGPGAIVFSRLLLSAAPASTGDPARGSASLAAVTSVQNGFLRTDTLSGTGTDAGTFVIGTTGGDPATGADDNKRLLYGFAANGASNPWSSFTTIRAVAGSTTTDHKLTAYAPSSPATVVGDVVLTVWTIQGIRVEQRLSLVTNPFTGRADTTRIQYTVINNSGQAQAIGIRVMLDVKIGDNDGAPYFVPGAGNLTKEWEFGASNMPGYWRAFESPTFDPTRLKGQGILIGSGATTPDRFVIGR